ncbi:hypothetical protein 1 [Beihai picorna-like virus 116]|uniref:hypothetical protein 1 n=1 Tax=Beihai picorna-like virus 116 TaxID=1922545 RepID=UPI00090C9DC6|nr:hypothetical protein 1 [Beihai picorna-like virus 116]APG78598.1 hypothetical protein 1 [Beihai picorna-like virus 116]
MQYNYNIFKMANYYEALYTEDMYTTFHFEEEVVPEKEPVKKNHRLVETQAKAFWTNIDLELVQLLDTTPVVTEMEVEVPDFNLPPVSVEDITTGSELFSSDVEMDEEMDVDEEMEQFDADDFWPVNEEEEMEVEEEDWDQIRTTAMSIRVPIVLVNGRGIVVRTIIHAVEQGILSDFFPTDFFPACLKPEADLPDFSRLEKLMNIAAEWVPSEQIATILDNHVLLCEHVNGWHKTTYNRFLAFWSEMIRTFPGQVDCMEEILSTYSPKPRTAANKKYCQRNNARLLDDRFEWLRVMQTVSGIHAREEMFGFSKAMDNVANAAESLSGAGSSIDAFFKSLDAQVGKVSESCTNAVNTATEKVEKISEQLDAALSTEEGTTSSKVWTIIRKVKENAPALIMCLVALTRATDKVQLTAHLLSISYMLGISKMVLEKLYSWFASTSPVSAEEEFIDAREEMEYSSTMKLLGFGASFLGEFSPSKILTGNARGLFTAQKEMEAMTQLSEMVMNALEEWGIYDSKKSQTIRQLRDALKVSIEHIAEYETMMTTKPAAFLREVYFNKFLDDYNRVEQIKTQIATTTYTELSGTNFKSEVMSLTTRYKEVRRVVDKTRACSGKRPTPVGIAFMGAAGIGKSYLQTNLKMLLTRRFKERQLHENPQWEGLSDLPYWQVWNQNTKDQYHEGYVGQEIHNVDDMFQSSEQEDHLDYINMISCNVFPTRQAEISNKGTPYKARVVVGSCNHFPQTSKTINAIDALQRRFSVVQVSLHGSMPTSYDPTFSHLRFEVWRDGRDYANDMMGGAHQSETMTLTQLLDYILDSMKMFDDMYNATIDAEFEANRYEETNFVTKRASADEIRRLKLKKELNPDWTHVLAHSPANATRALRTQRVKIDGTEHILTELPLRHPIWKRTAHILKHTSNLVYEGWHIALGDCWTVDDDEFVAVEWTSPSSGTVWIGGSAENMNSMDEEEFEEYVHDSTFQKVLKTVLKALTIPFTYLMKLCDAWNSWVVDPITDAIMHLIMFLLDCGADDPFCLFMRTFVRLEISFVMCQLVMVFMAVAWFSVRAVILRNTQTCESCKDPEREAFNQKLLCGFCRNHCKIGYFYTSHSDECKTLKDTVKALEAADCSKCINGFCDKQCPHALILEETIDARKVHSYLDAVDEVMSATELDAEVTRLLHIDNFEDEVVKYESSSMSKKTAKRRKVDLEDSSNSKRSAMRRSVLLEDSSNSKRSAKRRTVNIEDVDYSNLTDTEASAYRHVATRDQQLIEFESMIKDEQLSVNGGIRAIQEMSKDEAGIKLQAKLTKSTVQVWALKKSGDKEKVMMKIHGIAFGRHVLIPRHLSNLEGYRYVFIDRRDGALPGDMVEILRNKEIPSLVLKGDTVEIVNSVKRAYIRQESMVPISFVKASKHHDYALWSFEKEAYVNAFPNTFYDNLITKEDIIRNSQRFNIAVQYAPMSGLTYVVQLKLESDLEFNLVDRIQEYEKIWKVKAMHLVGAQTSPGDCGGVITCLDTGLTRKVAGFHVMGAQGASYAALITREGVDELIPPKVKLEGVAYDVLEDEVSPYPILDPSKIVPFVSDGVLTPPGDIVAVGETANYYREAGPTQIKRHLLAGAFEDTMAPAPLTVRQVGDPTKLMENGAGHPDILYTQYAKYAAPEPEVEGLPAHLEDMVEQLTERYVQVLQDHDTSFANEDEALNGVKGNPDSHPLDVRTSPGVPWSNIIPGGKKVHFLESWDDTDGNIRYVISDTEEGKALKEAIDEKRALGQIGYRTASIWKNCLKDETRPLDKVQIGKTRLFTAAPFETVYLFRECYSKFKTAWTVERDQLFHSVGINPMSSEWTTLYRRMAQMSPYGNDADFGRFDGCLRSDFMRAAGRIVNDSIARMNNLNEEDQLLMKVLWEEIVTTLQVSRTEVSITKHGNPSGNPMTTVVNCIVNMMYHWYAYRRITGMTSLESFEQHVFFTCFGDDVLFCSNGRENGYVFSEVAKIMLELGQEYTTAAKDAAADGGEKPLSDLQFLKRTFYEESPTRVLAPLAQESIEQQFNWTMMMPSEYNGINAQIEEACIEACVHGPGYYNEFRSKIANSILSKGLQRYIQRPVGYNDARLLLARRIDGTTSVVARKIRNN